MLKKDHSLVAEGVVEVINHKAGAGFETKLPEKDLVFPDGTSGFLLAGIL